MPFPMENGHHVLGLKYLVEASPLEEDTTLAWVILVGMRVELEVEHK